MANSFSDKLKKIKARSKRLSREKSKIISYIIIVIISIMLVSFVAYNIYQMEMKKYIESNKKLEEAKNTAINNIKQMFSKYPDDPRLKVYITNIENSDSIEEINKIVNDAAKYIEFRKYKEETINNIKNMYGKYYSKSLYAQYIVNKIEEANSIEEIDSILKNSNIEENAKIYYLKSIENSVDLNEYYAILVFGKKTLISGKELIDYVKKLSLADIKNLTIVPVSFNKVAIVVPATHCGKIPFEGSKIEIYDKGNLSMEPIPGMVDSAYVIVGNIKYKESKSTSSTLNEDGDTTTLSTTSDIEYSLENVPGVIYATAAGKLDYNKIISKFGRYGEKFNKITSDTQIFDENAKYLLIVSIPSDTIPKLLSIKDMYIVRVE